MSNLSAIDTQKDKMNESEITEKEALFDKTYKCPVCNKDFKAKTVKVGKARQVGSDMDLRPRYQNIDSIKYDAVLCPHCGYAALSKSFDKILPRESKLVQDKISNNFHRKEKEVGIVSYDLAIEYYKLALLTAMVREGKDSEKAYICLKTAWLHRGKREELETKENSNQELLADIEEKENNFLKSSMNSFLIAREKESPPFYGMDEFTLDYLLAYLCIKFENYDYAKKLVSGIIGSQSANRRIKDKAADLKPLLKDK